MIAANPIYTHGIGDDFRITKTKTRADSGAHGTWVMGTLNGHRFEALVFSEHADNPDWELHESRISKLWIQRLSDGEMVFNWDRGMDVDAEDDVTKAIVMFLCGVVANEVYGK